MLEMKEHLHTGQANALYHIRVELVLQKPLIIHEPRMVQLPNLEDRLFYERQ